MSNLCLAPELAFQEGLGAPQEASGMGSNPMCFPFGGAVCMGMRREGYRGAKEAS